MGGQLGLAGRRAARRRGFAREIRLRTSADPFQLNRITFANRTKDDNMCAKVLVVDDSGTMRKIIIRSLNALGVTDIVEAADGSDGLEVFKQHQFDAVLTDWNMPRMTGLELLKAIRATGSAVPIVLITTEAEKGRVLEAVQAGVSDYLVKPFETEGLRKKLQKFLSVAVA
jgi:two-component system chemotaxis response regulator CheY